MNKLSKNPIDQYFRETLESPDLKYNKQDWKGLEARLPRKSKRNMIAWLLPIAAALLIFVSLWIFKGPVTKDKRLSKFDTVKSGSDSNTKLTERTELAEPDVLSNPDKIPLPSGEQIKSDYLEGSSRIKRIAIPTVTVVTEKLASEPTFAKPVSFTTGSMSRNNEFNSLEISRLTIPTVSTHIKSNNAEPSADSKSTNRVSLALSVSPDLNSVSHFSNSNLGMSIGFGAIYRITPHLSITTGLGYSKKEYSAMPYEYKAPWATSNAGKYAKSIDADCRVLDVPVSLNYTISNSNKRALFVSAGLSSYFMLNEKYILRGTSQSGYPQKTDPSYSYKNENNHLFSVVNLSVGMSRPLNKNTSIVIQPYVKLPYTGIGQGKVNLQSTGINFQLQFNFPRKIKLDSPSDVAQ